MNAEDANLRIAVSEELFGDLRVHIREIAVTVANGVVTLRGTVPSLATKQAAEEDAKSVYGVRAVDNGLDVSAAGAGGADSELRVSVLQALMLNQLVPKTVDVQVENGWVRLVGSVAAKHQADESVHLASRILGVRGVTDDLVVVPATESSDGSPSGSEMAQSEVIKSSIERSIGRSARLRSESISVGVSGSTVTFTGTVGSWADREAVAAVAWKTPGVTNVVDNLTVLY